MNEGRQLLQAIETRLKKNEEGLKQIGQGTLSVGSATAVGFSNIPERAIAALIQVDADATITTASKAIKFYESGKVPTSTTGMTLGDLDTYEITNHENIVNFKAIGIEASKTHTIQVLFYGV